MNKTTIMKKYIFDLVILMSCAMVTMAQTPNYIYIMPTGTRVGISSDSTEFYFNNSIRIKNGSLASDTASDLTLKTNEITRMTIKTGTGYIGIGTTAPQAKLDVRGTMRADEILVNNVSGADFVFAPNYTLRSLDEVNTYIKEYQHLPEIPSAEQMQEEGMSVDKMVVKLLQKVEELTLYTIQQEERIKELENNQK